MILYILYFILGLCAGSFLNAVIFRLENGESIILGNFGEAGKNKIVIPAEAGIQSIDSRLRGNDRKKRIARSQCPYCRHKLAWYDLIPVLSFLWLGGKCRHCEERISYQYPAVEITTGALFIAIFNFKFLIFNQFLIPEFLNGHWSLVIGHFINIVFWLYITSALIVIFVYDLKHYIIPDKILFPAIAISIMYHVLSIMQAENYALYIIHNTLYYVGSAIGASAFFLLLVLISRGRAMGLGDVKLAFLMGLILGWPNILVALFSAFFFGALVGLVLIFGGRKTLKSKIPFGPFLIAGTFIALFWGNWLVDWYLRLLL
jgi:prepilin signal peptidase PulO-like enzyme (type II secretory pathway)